MSAGRKKAPGAAPAKRLLIATNKKGLFKYHVEEKFEAGLELMGTEVKSLRDRGVNFTDSYARLLEPGPQLYLFNLNIAPYEPASRANHAPTRTRRLLLHRREINRLAGKLRQKGFTLIPTAIYFSGPWAKIELGLATHKTPGDKRRDIIDREQKRDLDRARKYRDR